jgi:hypothetical protein
MHAPADTVVYSVITVCGSIGGDGVGIRPLFDLTSDRQVICIIIIISHKDNATILVVFHRLVS